MKLKRFIRITRGEYKGYTGTILEIVKGKFVVRVDSNNRIISLDKDAVVPLDIKQESVEIKKDTASTPSRISSRASSSRSSSRPSVSRSRSSTGSFQAAFGDKGNFFKNIEQKLKEKQNPYLFDVSELMQLLDISDNFSDIKEAEQINIIISNSELKNQEVKKKLFIIAHFFVQLNKRNMQIPYRLLFKNIVSPNDDYNYILNAAVLMKYIPKSQVDTSLVEKYINIILNYYGIELTSIVQRAEVLEKIRERRAQIKFPRKLTPKLPLMKFVQRKSSDIKPELFKRRDNLIQNYITDIRTGKITVPANIDKNFVIKALEDLLGKKNMIRSPTISKNPDLAYLNSIVNAIKIEERQMLNDLKFPDVEKSIKGDIKNKVRDLIISRINNQVFNQKTAGILTKYVNNIENPDYFKSLTNSEKTVVEPYRRYFNSLVQNNIDILPAKLGRKRSSFTQENHIKTGIRQKIINMEKGRLRKLMSSYKDHAPLLEILVNNYNDYVVNLTFKDRKEIEIDKNSGLYTHDEMMLKLAQRELNTRLNDILTKNYQNLNFYSTKSQEKFAN